MKKHIRNRAIQTLIGIAHIVIGTIFWFIIRAIGPEMDGTYDQTLAVWFWGMGALITLLPKTIRFDQEVDEDSGD